MTATGNKEIGKLIVFEGLDRVGKTTQCNLLTERLSGLSQGKVKCVRFPDRSTPVGKLIDAYLSKRSFSLPDTSIHLLFSSNRWELFQELCDLLMGGTTVIIDRYVFSGIAYSNAKNTYNMNIEWCLQPDKGLLKPDYVIFMYNSNINELQERDNYGAERYENVEFQRKVYEAFNRTWEYFGKNINLTKIDVHKKSISEIHSMIWEAERNVSVAEHLQFL